MGSISFVTREIYISIVIICAKFYARLLVSNEILVNIIVGKLGYSSIDIMFILYLYSAHFEAIFKCKSEPLILSSPEIKLKNISYLGRVFVIKSGKSE